MKIEISDQKPQKTLKNQTENHSRFQNPVQKYTFLHLFNETQTPNPYIITKKPTFDLFLLPAQCHELLARIFRTQTVASSVELWSERNESREKINNNVWYRPDIFDIRSGSEIAFRLVGLNLKVVKCM